MSSEIHAIKRKLFDIYFSQLNPQQREAIYTTRGPLLVVAGAGCGKTTVLVYRILFLVRFGNAYFSEKEINASPDEIKMLRHLSENPKLYDTAVLDPILDTFAVEPCDPEKILAITFTNKAAREIKERLSTALGDRANAIWSGTFHSVCVRLLRYFSDQTPFGRTFTIYDQDDCKKIIASLLKEDGCEDAQMTPRAILTWISRVKNEMKTEEEIEEECKTNEKKRAFFPYYKRYQSRLKDANALDFDDLICQTVRLLQENDSVRRWCQNHFQYVLVDEYQDTNHAQYLFMKLIGKGTNNVMVVGDDDQSIYKFRGAAVENILKFDSQFSHCKVIKLEQNYRSTRCIIDAAGAVIENNKSRRGKSLWSGAGRGDLIKIHQLRDQEAEAVFITDTIHSLIAENQYQYSNFAVLYRTKAQSNSLETVFAKSGLPYRLLGGLRFTDRAEVKDVLAYLRFTQNHQDFISFARIINVPRRGIGQTTIQKVQSICGQKNLPLYEVLKSADQFEELQRSSAKLKAFCDLIDHLTEFSKEHLPSEVFHETLDRSGYFQTLLGTENEDKKNNVEELLSSAKIYEERNEDPTLEGFLEEMALISDIDNYDGSANAVSLMTIHAAKGLEFSTVFLSGMEENLFPSPQSINTTEDLEEERRLFYVAMTRAKNRLFITCTRSRMLYGRTSYNDVSRFVKEIPPKFTELTLYTPSQEEDATPWEGKDYVRVYSVNGFDRDSSTQNAYRRYKLPRNTPFAEKKKPEPVRFFEEGDRVVHAVFGAGYIQKATKYGSDTLYQICFDHAGTKKLMATYAKLKPEEE